MARQVSPCYKLQKIERSNCKQNLLKNISLLFGFLYLNISPSNSNSIMLLDWYRISFFKPMPTLKLVIIGLQPIKTSITRWICYCLNFTYSLLHVVKRRRVILVHFLSWLYLSYVITSNFRLTQSSAFCISRYQITADK